MLSVPMVLLLGFLAFGLVKWGGQKVSGVLVGVLFGLALAATAIGPSLISAFNSLSESLLTAVGSAIS